MRVLVVGLLLLTAVTATSVRAQSMAGSPPVGTFSGCPRDTRPLPEPVSSFERPLRIVVLQFIRTSFPKLVRSPPSQLVGARVRSLILVRSWPPSGWIKTECGVRVWQNSVAVDVYFPRMDPPHNPVGHCNACAHLTFLAARTSGGWTVWGRY
jgi:hypothetical protein